MEFEVDGLKIGCSGFSTAQVEYSKLYKVVEVQQTFYQPPRMQTLFRWRTEFPENFEFVIKAWQLITHEAWSKTFDRLKIKLTPDQLKECGYFRDSQTVKEAWMTTLECASILSARFILFQCPAGFKPVPANLDRIRNFFNTIERKGLKLGWEPRGDWPNSLVKELCRELDLIHVVDPFLNRPATPEPVYFRLHGGIGYKHIYSDNELEQLLHLLPASGERLVFFNNINMLQDSLRFIKLVESIRAD